MFQLRMYAVQGSINQSIIYYHSVNPNRIQSPYGCGISQF